MAKSTSDDSLKYFSQTVIILLFFSIASVILALTGLGTYVESWFFKIVGKFDIFKVWVSLLSKSVDLNADPSASGLIGLIKPMDADLGGGLMAFFGFMTSVLAKAFFDCLFASMACTLVKIPLKHVPLIADAIGVTIGLILSTFLKSVGNSLLYVIVSLALLLMGIAIMTSGKLFFLTRRQRNSVRYGFIGPVLMGLPIPLATTGYATVVCLVAAKKIGLFWVFPAALVYILILLYWEYIAKNVLRLKARGNPPH